MQAYNTCDSSQFKQDKHFSEDIKKRKKIKKIRHPPED